MSSNNKDSHSFSFSKEPIKPTDHKQRILSHFFNYFTLFYTQKQNFTNFDHSPKNEPYFPKNNPKFRPSS